MNIPLILQSIRPGAEWSLDGEEYGGLQWIGPGEAPTLAELEAACDQMQSTPPPVPAPTMRSFRLACGRALWTRIAAAIAGITNEDAKWEALQYIQTSPNVTRNYPLVVQLAAALSPPLTDEQVDSVFALALQLDAQA